MGAWFASLSASAFFRKLGSGLKAAWTWTVASSTHLLIVALGLALIFGLAERHGKQSAQRDLASCQAARKADSNQWTAQVKAANAATAAEKAKGKVVSSDVETFHNQLQSDTAGLRRYVSDHSVRPGPRAPATPGASSGNDPPVPAQPPAVPTVAVPSAVLSTCDADYTYAESAYQLGQKLISQGLAEPQK